MKIQEKTRLATTRDLLTSSSQLHIILSPNYEPRSISAGIWLAESLKERKIKPTFHLMTLQGTGDQVEPLEHLKRENSKTIKSILQSNRYICLEQTIPYPDNYSPLDVEAIVKSLDEDTDNPFTLAVDISAIPRKILISIVQSITRLISQGSLAGVYFLYTWSESYPSAHFASEVGKLVPVNSRKPFPVMSAKRSIKAALFMGRQGYDAKQFLDSLPPRRSVTGFIFYNRDNPQHSLDVIRANSAILADRTVTVKYFLTIDDGLMKMAQWANPENFDDDTLALFAPFGPKPLIVSAVMAMQNLESRNVESDIVLLSGHQYSSTYSIGSRTTSSYALYFSR